ncbi:MAG TPA: GNAT family protein [Anaerolineaceae bacterium]|nr:GNAT family protein [Anaerolineaceae bacterium]
MIVGDHIRLRAIERSDIPRFVEWLNDVEVTRHLLLYTPLSMDMEEAWFSGMERRAPEERPLGIEIETAAGWQLIGNVGFQKLDWRVRETEIGIFIGEKSLWSKGYGRRAMAMMIRHGFDTLNLNRIWLRVNETNPRGIRAYESLGFVHEGRQRQASVQDGRYIDVLLMSVLRSEWQMPEY